MIFKLRHLKSGVWIPSPSILNYSKQKCQLLMEDRVQNAPRARRDGTNLNFKTQVAEFQS
jgi:hypothetical protein